MSMDHGPYVRTHAVDREVHHDFARWIVNTAELLAVKVHDHHVFRAHHAFAEAGGRDQHAVWGQTDGEVAVRRGHKAQAMEHLAETSQVAAQLALRAG